MRGITAAPQALVGSDSELLGALAVSSCSRACCGGPESLCSLAIRRMGGAGLALGPVGRSELFLCECVLCTWKTRSPISPFTAVAWKGPRTLEPRPVAKEIRGVEPPGGRAGMPEARTSAGGLRQRACEQLLVKRGSR